MRQFLYALAILIGSAVPALAYCPTPNPNVAAPPFVDNCPLPAAALNRLSTQVGINPATYGAVGNGIADDTAALAAAGLVAETTGLPLILQPKTLYKTTSTLTFPGPIQILGRGQISSQYSTSCASGILNTSNTDILVVNGEGSKVIGVCIQAGTSGAQASGGAAIRMGATALLGASHQELAWNTVYYPYYGIEAGGPTTGTTQTGNLSVHDNFVLDGVAAAYTNGRLSSSASTNDSRWYNNTADCISGSCNTAAYGFANYDGSIISFTGGDLYNYYVGFAMVPGTANAVGQHAAGFYSGLLADTSVLHGVLINPTTSLGAVFYTTFSNWWVGGNTDSTGSHILIGNSNSGSTKNVTFSSGIVHGSTTTQCIFDLENNVSGITLTGNQIAADGGGTGDTGLCVNTTGNNIVASGNNFMAKNGTLAVGILLEQTAPNNQTVDFTGNDMSGATIDITDSVVNPVTFFAFANNQNQVASIPTIAEAAGLTLAPAVRNTYLITGTGTSITTMGPCWEGRHVTLIGSNASGIVTATGGATSGNMIPFEAGVSQSQYNGQGYTCSGSFWYPSS